MSTRIDDLTVRDIASRDLVTLSPDMTLREAIGVLDQYSIHGAPVVASGGVVGVLSATDLLAFEATTPAIPAAQPARGTEDEGDQAESWNDDQPLSAYFTDFWEDAGADVVERMQATEGPEWDMFGEHVVSEAMSSGIRAVQATDSLAAAAAYMLQHRIHRALVLEGQQLFGVVSAMDFLRAIAGPAHQPAPEARRAGARRHARPPRSRRPGTRATD